MPEPVYLLILAPWAPLLAWTLARYGFGRYGVIVHALALLATLLLGYAVIGLWLNPIAHPPAGAFSSVERLMLEVEYWWALYLYRKAWPLPVLVYFGLCWLFAVLLVRRHPQWVEAPRQAHGDGGDFGGRKA